MTYHLMSHPLSLEQPFEFALEKELHFSIQVMVVVEMWYEPNHTHASRSSSQFPVGMR